MTHGAQQRALRALRMSEVLGARARESAACKDFTDTARTAREAAYYATRAAEYAEEPEYEVVS